MLQYASREVKAQLKQQREKSLSLMEQQTHTKMKGTMLFLQEWTNDLMERQSELQQVRRQLLCAVAEPRKSERERRGMGLDVQALIKDEFFSKMEDLYGKQLLVAQQTDRLTQQEEESVQDSLNQSMHNHTFSQEHELEASMEAGSDY